MRGCPRPGRHRLASLLAALILAITAGVTLRVDNLSFVAASASAAAFAPQDVGNPSSVVLPDGSQQLAFWKSSAGHLVEAWYAGGAWNGPLDLTAAVFGGAAPLESAPSASVTPDGSTQLVFWQGAADHLYEAWYAAASWHGPVDFSATDLGGATLTSAPSITLTPDGNQQMAFWRGPGNDLFEAWYAAGSWHGPADLSSAIGAPGALASAPGVTVTRDGATQLVFWQGWAGNLEEAWYAGGGWHGPLDVSGSFLGGTSVASPPSVTTTTDGAQQLVYWKGNGEHLLEAWYAGGSWHGPLDLTGTLFGGTGSVTGPPSVAVTPDGSSQLVFWQGAGQSLWEAWYTGAWNGPHDFSPPPAVPSAAGCGAAVPAGKVVEVSLSRQSAVFYQDRCVVQSTLVTTGRPGLRTPTGTFHIQAKSSPMHFVSPWPRSSPYYYSPETTQWGMRYENGGYYLHDAPWEPADAYGPGSQNGPSASHGCIHVPTPVMQWLYSWAGIGTTVIVTG